MCGIAGILSLGGADAPSEPAVTAMLGMLQHRGPDEFGIYRDDQVALGNARLAIIDLEHGQQPIANEDGSLWIVFNGEIFNYRELRSELEQAGHRFRTASDTEVLLHAFEAYGARCLRRLNGQFAFAIWNRRERSLFLARDRLGVRPLFYTRAGERLFFGSEIKALFALPEVPAAIDPVVLDQVFTFWSAPGPRTIFRGIEQLPPCHYLVARAGRLSIERYGAIPFVGPAEASSAAESECVDALERKLLDAVRLRLRADVPVGCYLSGGLDSSLIAAMVTASASAAVDTFSVAFTDRDFDERAFQERMARRLGTRHHVVEATAAEIGRIFPEVVWHAETPLTRTAPAPMYLLSRCVHEVGYKVVLTGEGADEFLAGYDLFKEAKIRRFWAREPESRRRPTLLRRLYRDIAQLDAVSPSMLAAFFAPELTKTELPYYSHLVRWRTARRATRYFSPAAIAAVAAAGRAAMDAVEYPPEFGRWGALERAQYLEIAHFLSSYLLSSQGDRMSLAHAVEGRFPFLDVDVVEFCCRLPARLKLRGLREKHLLKEVGRRWLPAETAERPKRPYRAPIWSCFFGPAAPDYVTELLSPERLRESGFFEPAAVAQLRRRIGEVGRLGESDDMAVAGIVSTQLLHEQFVRRRPALRPLPAGARLQVVRRDSGVPTDAVVR